MQIQHSTMSVVHRVSSTCEARMFWGVELGLREINRFGILDRNSRIPLGTPDWGAKFPDWADFKFPELPFVCAISYLYLI